MCLLSHVLCSSTTIIVFGHHLARLFLFYIFCHLSSLVFFFHFIMLRCFLFGISVLLFVCGALFDGFGRSLCVVVVCMSC